MDSLTFISEIVKAIAWPVSAIALVFFLRKPIIELVPLMKKLKFKELELEFSRDLLDLKEEVGVSETIGIEQEKDTKASSHIMNVLSLSTRSAIMEAWIEVESAAIEVASSLWGESPKNAIRDMPRLGEYLLQCNVIDQRQLNIFNKLRQLRNKSAHVAELHLSESDAKEYINMALNLATQLRKAEMKSNQANSSDAKNRRG